MFWVKRRQNKLLLEEIDYSTPLQNEILDKKYLTSLSSKCLSQIRLVLLDRLAQRESVHLLIQRSKFNSASSIWIFLLLSGRKICVTYIYSNYFSLAKIVTLSTGKREWILYSPSEQKGYVARINRLLTKNMWVGT